MNLKDYCPTAKTGHEQTLLQRQIDKLVYELYSQTAKEIAIVEKMNNR